MTSAYTGILEAQSCSVLRIMASNAQAICEYVKDAVRDV
jgi:hypothetical protein